MKLAEALMERADLQKRIAQINERMKANVRVQEGDEPAENVTALLVEYEEMTLAFVRLVNRINRTNVATSLGHITLAEAITARDAIKARANTYQTLYQAATLGRERYSRSEIKFVRCVDAKMLQNKADKLSKEHREFDAQIQAVNWTTDLLE